MGKSAFRYAGAALLVPVIVLSAGPAAAQPPTTRLVSVSSAGVQTNHASVGASISADGRYVAFASWASNLVPGDTNNVFDVFVRDLLRGVTTRVSVSSAGVQANNASSDVSISADGRYVAFASSASNLVPGDTNDIHDIFVRDLLRGVTTRVSVSSTGTQANGVSLAPSISADGRYISFMSSASNLVPDDTNNTEDIFVRDLRRGVTIRVNVSNSGAQANSGGGGPSISADGRYISFMSHASNLVPDDTNSLDDIFVRDVFRGVTTRVSVSSAGTQANGGSLYPSISGNGRYITFTSYASNLVPGDTNDIHDIFVRDLLRGVTTRVSVSSTGVQGDERNFYPAINFDGRYVTFQSYASNLVPNDTNDHPDIFVHDRLRGVTTRVSVSDTGAQANDSSAEPAISADGRRIAFESYASNLVPNDTNYFIDIFVRDWDRAV